LVLSPKKKEKKKKKKIGRGEPGNIHEKSFSSSLFVFEVRALRLRPGVGGGTVPSNTHRHNIGLHTVKKRKIVLTQLGYLPLLHH